MDLILASTSPYRRSLLQRLQVPFTSQAPDVDEKPRQNEAPRALAQRLALAKARTVASQNPSSLVLGSDQVASIDGSCIGKPGNHATATAQLQASSGRRVDFYTAIALVCLDTDHQATHVETFSVEFRQLTPSEIEVYLNKEQPYDCAGSFKCEGLGIALFERMIGDDPTSLEGLPLISTSRLLGDAGHPVLTT